MQDYSGRNPIDAIRPARETSSVTGFICPGEKAETAPRVDRLPCVYTWANDPRELKGCRKYSFKALKNIKTRS